MKLAHCIVVLPLLDKLVVTCQSATSYKYTKMIRKGTVLLNTLFCMPSVDALCFILMALWQL